MSAGNSPPNPNAPRSNPTVNAHRPGILGRRAGLITTGVALFTTAYLYMNYSPNDRQEPFITARTPGVQNIEKAYTNAGATGTHTKAYGGTTQGDKNSVALKEGGATGTGSTNKESPYQQEGVGDDQRPTPPSKGGEIFDATMYGSKKGK